MFTREDLSNISNTGESYIPTIQNIKIDWKGVHKLLKNLKVHKATDPDEIPAYIIKTAADELAPALALLFQLSIDQEEIPQDWKQALVVPFFKKGDKHQPSNYRPVSFTSITCKPLEQYYASILCIILIGTESYVTTNMDSGRNAHAKPNCCQQYKRLPLQQTRDTLKVDIILLDFAKAFDKVPHTRLLHKLNHCGVRGNVKRWIESYLSHR